MKIAIVGAGFTGLSLAYTLTKNNHEVFLFEKEKIPGGLAGGYKERGWDWSLEKHYHHFFANDKNAFDLAKEINYEIITKTPKTSVLINDCIHKLDSPKDVFTFPLLNFFERLRMAATLGFLRYNPFWQFLEKYKTSKSLPKLMGKKSYQLIWEPLLVSKFQKFSDNISLAWFWARIKKRTPSLAYPKGGFLEFASKLVKLIEDSGGKVLFNTEVIELTAKKNLIVKVKSQKLGVRSFEFDKAIVTLPSFLFLKIAKDLPLDYQNKLKNLKGIGAINMVLRLNKPFLTDDTYWLNICEKDYPFLSIVEHTNFMDKKSYNNEHLVYIGSYLPANHPYMKISADELLKIYDPYLRRINPNFKFSILNFKLFTSSFAQPIIPINYSKIIPSFETPLKNVYLANIEQVYPWDRGTNYAVELGNRIAKLIIKEKD